MTYRSDIVHLRSLVGKTDAQIYLIVGPPGAGKEAFALQYMIDGFSEKNNAVFITTDDFPDEIEENYKRLKQWVEIENFSGKSALSMKQDFYAKIVATNLTALMAMAAQKTIGKKTQHHQLNYQINFAQAVSKMKHRIVYLIRQSHSDITLFIKRTILYISQTIEAIRDGRSVPRRLKNLKNGIHFPAYKNTL